MYPQRELRQLAFNKARLQRRLGRRRDQCAAAASRLAEPLEWLDRARERWRQISPVLKISGLLFGVFARRPILSGGRRVGKWLRWGATAFSLFRGFNAMRR